MPENHLKIPVFSSPSEEDAELSESDDDDSSTLEDLVVLVESLTEATPSLDFDLGPEEMRMPFQWTTAIVKI